MYQRLLLLVLGVSLALTARADDLAVTARKLVGEHAASVLTIRLVIKEQYDGGGMDSAEYEQVSEITGTVIQPDGLMVTALSATDPAHLYEGIMDAMPEEAAFKFETSLSKVVIVASDGKEIPAKVVLRDKDLDLAFLRPVAKPSEPWAHVPLTGDASVEPFDELVLAYRLGIAAARGCTASFPRVANILQKPRKLYFLGSWDGTELGGPAFTTSGQCLGIAVMRFVKSGSPSVMSMLGGDPTMAPVIVPGAAVLESAAQATEEEAQPEEAPAPAQAPKSAPEETP
jgi:hypothetical protein